MPSLQLPQMNYLGLSWDSQDQSESWCAFYSGISGLEGRLGLMCVAKYFV